MRFPEGLVTAVAAELHVIFGGKVGYCHHETSVVFADGTTGPYRRCEQDAPRLVAAVLRALPDCPDPIDPSCCQNGEWRGHACQYHQGYEDGWDAAIAKLADDE